MKEDPVVEEVRAVRRRISADCEDDARKLVAFYRREQAKYAHRFWKPRQLTEHQ